MNDQRTIELARRLKEESANKRLNWAPSAYANSFRLSLGKGMVVLDYNSDNPLVPLLSLTIFNERNSIIDTLSTETNSDDNYM